jgi:hypothetical protein
MGRAERWRRPDECDILINPRRPDAGGLIAKKIRRRNYDARLV